MKKLLTVLSVTALVSAPALVHAYGDKPKQNIVEVASAAGTFKTLVAAVTAADLAGTLSGEGPFTVFAPTDEAFAKLPAGTVENLLKPENKDRLVAVLTYHVVPAKVKAADVQTGQSPTVNGAKLNLVKSADGVKVNNANVTAADVRASNGVIHVIDTVLIPE
jgi:uncharacterized surface protein with fasciclin (FAS1) repeats